MSKANKKFGDAFENALIQVGKIRQATNLYELDMQYNPKVLEWLKQFHVKIMLSREGIAITVPFRCASDLQNALDQLRAAVNP